MDRFDPVRRFDAPRVIAARAVAATILDCDRPRILADFDADGAVMVGVARLKRDTIHALWERHDGGDEMLVVILLLTLEDDAGAVVDRELAAGEGAWVPTGRKHRYTAIEKATIIEVSTPELNDVVRLSDDFGREGTNAP